MYVNEIVTETIVITTTGGDGNASGSGTTVPIMGFLLDIAVDYHASAPATTDLTISETTFGNVLVLTNTNTDGVYMPRKQICNPAGAAQALYDLIPLKGPLTVSVAQADALTACVTVTIRWVTP